MTTEIKEIIIQQTRIVSYLADCYYSKDSPMVSDGEYDAQFRELQLLEKKYPQYALADSPTMRVGGEVLKSLGAVRHTVPMLSLANAMNASEAESFDNSVKKALGVSEVAYSAEPKYDGLSCDLRYENGIFMAATTRGDGESGEDVTSQARTIRNLPLCLTKPLTMSVRGEVMMSDAAFVRVNKALVAKGEKPLVNTRNGAAGSMRQLDTSMTASRQLSFFVYSTSSDLGVSTQGEVLQELKALGFEYSEHATVVQGFKGIEAYFAEMSALRSKMGIGIDGLVFKVNSLEKQLDLGFNHRTPKWACAFKFPPEEMPTLLEGIDIQIGRTGIATPVGRLKPVFVGGVTVTNATLHNIDQIELKDVRIGDTVIVRRAGDVIPEIAGPMLDRRPIDTPKFVMPEHCPVCDSLLHREIGTADYVCTGGMLCDAQRLYSLAHFGSRLCLNIDGMGESTVKALMGAGLVKMASDFFTLKLSDVAALDGFGHQSALNLIQAIEGSKGSPLNRFIFALGIKGVGEKTAKDLSKAFMTWERFLQASDEDLLAVNGIGPSTVDGVRTYFGEELILEEAKKLGEIIKPTSVETGDVLFAGKNFVLTGSLPSLSREQATSLIEKAGGKVTGSVSKKTFAVVSGEASGSKLDKALALGVQVWDQETLIKQLGN